MCFGIISGVARKNNPFNPASLKKIKASYTENTLPDGKRSGWPGVKIKYTTKIAVSTQIREATKRTGVYDLSVIISFNGHQTGVVTFRW